MEKTACQAFLGLLERRAQPVLLEPQGRQEQWGFLEQTETTAKMASPLSVLLVLPVLLGQREL